MAASTRRAALGAILAAPITGGVVMALPSGSAAVTVPTDLARACEWATAHWAGISPRCRAEDWDDDKLDAEMDLYDAVWDRALAEPSFNPADLKAKARLCLQDYLAHTFPFTDPAMNKAPDDLERMVITVLQEVIELCT